MPPKCLLKPRTSSRTSSSGHLSKNLSPFVKNPTDPPAQSAGHENKDHDNHNPEEDRIDFTRHPGQEPPEKSSMRTKLRLDKEWNDIIKHLFLCKKTTIAQVHGYCLAHALMMVEKCDLIIASEDCKLGFVEERLMFGGMTMSPILLARVGLTRALDLSITGKKIDGKEAARINLVTRSVPADQLEQEVDELARAISLYPRDGLALSKAARQTVYETLGINQWFEIGAYLPHVLLLYMGSAEDGDTFIKALNEKGLSKAIHEKEDILKQSGLLKALDK